MEFFGFFREQSNSMGSPVSIQDFVGGAVSHEAASIATYLRSGTVVLEAEELVRDVLSPEQPVIGQLALLTDGDWTWPSDLAHYVESYGLRPPDRFVDRMRARLWHCSPVPDQKIEEALMALPVSREEDQ